MSGSTTGDAGVYFLSLLAPALIAVIAGLVIHSFIIVVNVNDWLKGRTLTPVDHIVTSLGISRMCLPCSLAVYILMCELSLKSLYLHIVLDISDVVYDFFVYVNIWLSSLLSIVLCLKISNLHTRLFLYLRRVIVQRTGYFIVASVLLSTCNILFPLLMAIVEVTTDGTYNATMNNTLMVCTSSYMINSITAAFIPVLFYCLSSVLIFTSLYLHMTNMKMSGNITINLETYYSVMKFVSFTFLYNTIYICGHLISAFYYYFHCVDLVWIFTAMEFLPVLHSSCLIYRTAKLRSQVAKLLQCVIDVLFQ